MADKKGSGVITGHLDKMAPWVREMAISLIGDVGTVFGIGVLSNYLRGKSTKQVTNQDLDRVHGQMSEVDQARIADAIKSIADYSAAINASSDPEDVKKRKIEEFSKNLLSTLSAGKKDGDKAKETEPKEFDEVLKASDEQTLRRFRLWFGRLTSDERDKFGKRQNEVTVTILKLAFLHYEIPGEKPDPEPVAARFSAMIGDLNPDQMVRYQMLFDALSPAEQKSFADAGDRIPRKIFLAELERVTMPTKRESEDFCAFRASLDEALGNRFDLFDSNLSSSDRVRLNAFRTWLTKDALRTWLPSIKECNPATAMVTLEQLEQFAKEKQAAAAVTFGPADASKILRRILASCPEKPSAPPASASVGASSSGESKEAEVLAYIISRLKPPAKPIGEVITELKSKISSMSGEVKKAMGAAMGENDVHPDSLPDMENTETKQAYFERIKARASLRTTVKKDGKDVPETDDQLRTRLHSAIEQKDARRLAKIKRYLAAGYLLSDIPQPPRT